MIVFSETGSRENMKNFGSGASGAFQHLFGGFGESIVGGFRSLKSNKVLLEQNTELEKLLLEERQKTALYDQLVLENQELRHVINFSRRLEYSNIPGIIISGSPSNTNNIITINLGRGHNIKKDMPVVGYDDSGIFLIGKIDTVNIVSSTVIPIFSEKFGTGGIVENTYHRGLVEGLGSFNNFLTLKYIGAEKNLENQPIAIGALITTSMDSQLFPEGIPIGYVEKIEKRAWENSSIIFLRPYADFSKLKYIYVLSGDIR
ncbi:MAG: rod shape-determining protein MreC [Spirochaetales bacterium]|nr:rod shape-determining protein MreC [Spirochaetales bacterium]